jgi:hypothetical protein
MIQMYCKCLEPHHDLRKADGKICCECGGKKPTAEEIMRQRYLISILNVIDYNKEPEYFKRILDECLEFESKYC